MLGNGHVRSYHLVHQQINTLGKQFPQCIYVCTYVPDMHSPHGTLNAIYGQPVNCYLTFNSGEISIASALE